MVKMDKEEYNDGDEHGYIDIDQLPIFAETLKFKELHGDFRALLREYIHREISAYWEHHQKNPPEHILIEIRKQMLCVVKEEYNIIINNDMFLRQFFKDNAAAILGKLQKKMEESR